MDADVLKVNDVTDSIFSWINKDFISKQLRRELSKANCLFLPYEGRGISKKNNFPVGASMFFRFVQENIDEDSILIPDLCIEDEDFCELHMHGVIVDLGKVIVTSIALPVFSILLASYIKGRLSSDEEVSLRFSVIVQEEGRSIEINYDGPKEGAIKYYDNALEANHLKCAKEKACR